MTWLWAVAALVLAVGLLAVGRCTTRSWQVRGRYYDTDGEGPQ